MIDPDGIMVTQKNDNNILKFGNIPEFDFITWDLEDDKEFKKYISTIEKEIRGSYEYRSMIKYLKDNMGMNEDSFIKVSGKDNYNIKIEIHHYPFSLYDIVLIVYRKRCDMHESLELQMVAKEVMMLHYKLLVGLIPLSTTVHELVHAGKIFIPVQNVLGRYQIFVDYYKPYIDEDQLDALNRIEKYSYEQSSDLLNTVDILDNNNITIQNTNPQYQLPDFNNMENIMNHRIEDIKRNNYRLPTLKEYDNLYRVDNPTDRNIPTKKPGIIFCRKED